MSHMKRKRGYLIYVVTLCIVASLAGVFFPFFGEGVEKGQVIYFNPNAILFGGEVSGVAGGHYYGFALSLNIPLLAFAMVHIVALFASLSARNTPRLLVATLVLEVILLVGIGFSRFGFLAVNPALYGGGLVFGPGVYVSLIGVLVGLFICVLELVLCIRFKHKRDAFR